MKKYLLVAIMACSWFTASALHIEYGNHVVINRALYENVYIAGGTVTINAAVHGDLVVAGGTIVINDTVTNDILLAGGNVTFNGYTGGDIRCAGGEIQITKNVNGDLVITGGRLIIDRGVTVNSVLMSGGEVTIDGTVLGEIKGAVGNLVINGNVMQDIDCRGQKITINGLINGTAVLAAGEMIIGEHAVFNKELRYWNRKGSPGFDKSLKHTRAVFDPSLRIKYGEWYFLGAAGILGLLWYLGMAYLMILIIQHLFAAAMKKAADTIYADTAKSLGIGVLYFIAVPVAVVLALVTIIAIPLAVIMMFSYIGLLFLATEICSVVLANWYNNRYDKNYSNWRLSFVAFVFFIVFKLLTITPFIGWVLMALVVCIIYGGILLNVRWKRTGPRKQEIEVH